jgi:AcrR family transcriptional regulator
MVDGEKRDKIIAAAYQVLAQKGYDKATTKEIAKAAGVAQGLINYYFASKDLLFAEVLKHETKHYQETFTQLEMYGEEKLSVPTLKKILELPKNRTLNNFSWIRLRYELFAIGLRNETISESLKETLIDKRAHLNELIKAVSHLPNQQSQPLSAILLAVFDGLALQKTSDHEFRYDEAYEMLAEILGSYFETLQKQKEQ